MRSPSFVRPGLLLVASVLFAGGCNYVHFGRPEKFQTDAKLSSEVSDLRVEKKMLQQELAIARKEGDVLRNALDHAPNSTIGTEELAAKLKATTEELNQLRDSYAALKAQRDRVPAGAAANTTTTAGRMAAAEQIADLRSKLGDAEQRLNESLRNNSTLQSEMEKLRGEIQQIHTENATLAQKLDQATAQSNEARSALAQLNSEFLAQKEARSQAEQAAEALRVQLHAMAAAAREQPATSLADARESSAGGAREIESTLHAPALTGDSTAAAMLSTSPEKLQAARERAASASAASAAPTAPTPAAKPPRTYVVKSGDSLEKISQKFYGRADRWSLVYAANSDLLGKGQPLKAGMTLDIPWEE